MKQITRLFLTLLILIGGTGMLARSASAELPPPPDHGTCDAAIEAGIDTLVNDLFDSRPLSGITLAATYEGEIVCEKGYGYRNWNSQAPMQAYSRSQIGSTTKVMTAMAMMHLIENPPANRPGLGILNGVYSNILTDQDYADAYVQGIRRHYPIVGMAIGNNNRVVTWYSDNTYTIGRSDDLDRYAAPTSFELPEGQTMADVLGIARGGPDNYVYSWYRDGRVAIGTPTDLDAEGIYWRVVNGENEPFRSNRKDTIVGMSMNEAGNIFYAYYHDGTVTSGTNHLDLKSRWDGETYDYTVPGDEQRRYDIVGIARSTNNTTLAWYSDDQASRGNATNLSAHDGLYDVDRPGIPNSRSYWVDQYEQVQIRHLLSHTSGLTRSGQAEQGAIKYGYDMSQYDPNTNQIPYKDSHRYVLSTRPLLFEPGSDYEYSNHGIGLVGHLIEVITGETWYDYLYENILLPAGAYGIHPRGTFFPDSNPAVSANPHKLSNGQIVMGADPVVNHPGSAAGSLKASAGDLARVMLATDRLAAYPDVLQDSTIAVMENRWFPTNAPTAMLGWHVRCLDDGNCNDERKLNHSGVTSGGTNNTGGVSHIGKYENYTRNNVVIDGINIAIVSNMANSDVNNRSLRDDLVRLANDVAQSIAASDIGEPVFNPLPNDDGIRFGDSASSLQLSFGDANEDQTWHFSQYEARYYHQGNLARTEMRDADESLVALKSQGGDFSPEGWVCAPHVNVCTPTVLVFVQPGKCPEGWSDADELGRCQADSENPGDLLLLDVAPMQLERDDRINCPEGWIYPTGSPFCVPNDLMVEDPNGTNGRPDGCPAGWIVSSIPGGCSPDFVQFNGRSTQCPEGWVKPDGVNICTPTSLTAPTPCDPIYPPPECNRPEWDVYLVNAPVTPNWITTEEQLVSAEHIVFSKPRGRQDIAAAQLDVGWTCTVQDDLTALCQANVAIVDSCTDAENCPLLGSNVPTAVTLQDGMANGQSKIVLVPLLVLLMLSAFAVIRPNRR